MAVLRLTVNPIETLSYRCSLRRPFLHAYLSFLIIQDYPEDYGDDEGEDDDDDYDADDDNDDNGNDLGKKCFVEHLAFYKNSLRLMKPYHVCKLYMCSSSPKQGHQAGVFTI